ncbi:MAG: DUF4212 domain-containing protein [Alysiella sp.]|uniref:DUF4212 domain-containing protein n=1 Tax=Alysiella sp. TaxID=1872483 RepID=UPI0026DC3D48|nr:DUF4212 domain-containing protein [Alysiella sp.]MDO4433794.1 DUF4212 domain-containing protein [Alysiella sp.]
MSEKTHDAVGYWKANIRLITICMIIWTVVSYGFAIILRPAMMDLKLFNGSDIGFWFGQQGSMLVFIALIFGYSWKMNKIDKEYGVSEE